MDEIIFFQYDGLGMYDDDVGFGYETLKIMEDKDVLLYIKVQT